MEDVQRRVGQLEHVGMECGCMGSLGIVLSMGSRVGKTMASSVHICTMGIGGFLLFHKGGCMGPNIGAVLGRSESLKKL